MPPGESARPVKAGCYRPARSSFFDCDDGTAQPPLHLETSAVLQFLAGLSCSSTCSSSGGAVVVAGGGGGVI